MRKMYFKNPHNKMCIRYDIVDGRSVVVQYSNWDNNHPIADASNPKNCVSVSPDNSNWQSVACNTQRKCVCQS